MKILEKRELLRRRLYLAGVGQAKQGYFDFNELKELFPRLQLRYEDQQDLIDEIIRGFVEGMHHLDSGQSAEGL